MTESLGAAAKGFALAATIARRRQRLAGTNRLALKVRCLPREYFPGGRVVQAPHYIKVPLDRNNRLRSYQLQHSNLSTTRLRNGCRKLKSANNRSKRRRRDSGGGSGKLRKCCCSQGRLSGSKGSPARSNGSICRGYTARSDQTTDSAAQNSLDSHSKYSHRQPAPSSQKSAKTGGLRLWKPGRAKWLTRAMGVIALFPLVESEDCG